MKSEPRSAFAVLTPPGRGGIAVVRCIGPRATAAIESSFRPARRHAPLPEAGALAYGHVVDARGEPLDEIILWRAGPDAWEVNCHGGPAAVRAVSDRLAALGLERVSPAALLEAEGAPALERDARAHLRSARTLLATRVLLDQLNGALGRAVEEAAADLGAGRRDAAVARVDALLGRWRTCGRILAAPPRVAVLGRPNVGKSTLVNRLAGSDRVLVSEVPGTTRDYVEVEAALEGVPVVLVDTAGLRDAGEGVEREGVRRARREAGRAEVVVYLLDAAAGAQAEDRDALASVEGKALAAWNKSDLAQPPAAPAALAISAARGDGLEALAGAILARLGWRAPEAGAAVPFTEDQAADLAAARQAAAEGRGDDARAILRRIVTAPSPSA